MDSERLVCVLVCVCVCFSSIRDLHQKQQQFIIQMKNIWHSFKRICIMFRTLRAVCSLTSSSTDSHVILRSSFFFLLLNSFSLRDHAFAKRVILLTTKGLKGKRTALRFPEEACNFYFKRSRTARGPTQPPMQRYQLFSSKSGQGVQLITTPPPHYFWG
jgi:hypothetical protein